MASEYANWAKAYMKKNPKASNEDRRAAFWDWRAKKGRPVPGSPQTVGQQPVEAAPPPPPPAFDPNYRDSEAETDLANIKARYDQQRVDASQQYKNYLLSNYGTEAVEQYDEAGVPRWRLKQGLNNETLGGQFAGLRRDRDLALDKQASNTAQRGMLRSGNRLVQQGQTRTGYTQAANQIHDQQRAAAEADRSAWSNAATGEASERYDALRQAGARRLNTYRERFGV